MGNYEQQAPLYSQKIVIQSDADIDVKAEYEKLRKEVDELALAQFKESKVDQAGLRIRIKGGKKYVSVTSILAGGKPYTADPEYGTRGTEIHRLCNQFIDEGIWGEPREPLSKLKYEDIKYKEFFLANKERLSFEGCQKEIEVFNDEHLYSGEIDLICQVDGALSLCDIKTGSWKLEQLVAYWKALGDAKIKQLCIFDLKKNKLEVFKLGEESKLAWERFLVARGVILGVFNV